ncbi:hypothetical protein Godav_029097, partial [Gossypium davidsonii]|nr:hypothetical protein [Gossypium davidsonii]
ILPNDDAWIPNLVKAITSVATNKSQAIVVSKKLVDGSDASEKGKLWIPVILGLQGASKDNEEGVAPATDATFFPGCVDCGDLFRLELRRERRFLLRRGAGTHAPPSLHAKMIDLYWTVIPVLLIHYYATHPSAQFDGLRSKIVIVLTWVWSIRLTHSYFRREKWQWGAREDWRFADMRLQYGKHWWWISFFSVYFSQQIFLIGICLPLYVVHSVDKPMNIWDLVAAGVCLCGIVIAYFADTQLHNFVTRNTKLKELGKPMVPNLDRGLWQYSRHPNYFGEQLWWWGLVVFAWNLGHGWTFVGSLINSMCFAYVTVLVEQRMLKQEYRAEAYRLYQKTTSVWIPWFRSSAIAVKDKDT